MWYREQLRNAHKEGYPTRTTRPQIETSIAFHGCSIIDVPPLTARLTKNQKKKKEKIDSFKGEREKETPRMMI